MSNTRLLLALGALALTTSSAWGLTVSGTTQANLNDGASIDATTSLPPSSFNQEFAISTNTATLMGMTFSFGTIQLSDVPVSNSSMVFWFDSNEPGNDPAMSIEELIILSEGNEIFNYDEQTFGSLMLDGSTDSPLGSGGDMALSIPTDALLGFGLTGSSILEFYWKQSGADQGNNPDEWTTVGDGSFDPNAAIDSVLAAPVPLPAGLPMALVGLGALAGVRRMRKST